uniref:C2-C2_1 domain-containing protein n=1 Tax=Echinostoma caproni TaxID=27848 RepID=A0A183BEY4_9TREM
LSLSTSAANQFLISLTKQSDETTPSSAIQDYGHLRLFLTWDFYDFETQATPVRNGIETDFNLTVQYPVNFDDIMLGYLHRGQCVIELHQSMQNQYRTIAKGQLNMAALLETT